MLNIITMVEDDFETLHLDSQNSQIMMIAIFNKVEKDFEKPYC